MKYVTIGIVVVIVAGALIYFLMRGSSPAAQTEPSAAGTQSSESQVPVAAINGLKIDDIQAGTGLEAATGKTVIVNYVGTLTNGTKFDSSYDRGQTFSFILGQGSVIPGWDQGLIGMKVGGKRRLTISPSLAYGAAGRPGVIPPNATLIFEVELLAVQ